MGFAVAVDAVGVVLFVIVAMFAIQGMEFERRTI